MIPAGRQVFDGELALKYARSRKSTSDFSRSYRQQQIIEAIIAQTKNTVSLTNISKITSLYDRYTEMVDTNLSAQELLSLAQYKDNIKHFASFVLHYECGQHHTLMKP